MCFYKQIPVFSVSLFLLFMFSCTPSEEFLRQQKERTLLEKQTVRVLIDNSNRDAKVSGDGKIRITDKRTGKKLHEREKGILVVSPDSLSGPIIVEAFGGHVNINGTPYRGKLELIPALGGLHIINIVDIENYLKGVVPSEVMPGWPVEVLKAQAVAARTYAYYHLMNSSSGSPWDLDATVRFQVYRGVSAEADSTNSAVMQTAGEIITYNGKPIIAYFHSTCGGGTVNGGEVWSGSDFPYLAAVRCPHCSESPHYEWKTQLSLDDIRDAVAARYKTVTRINSIRFNRTGNRVAEVKIVHSNGNLALGGNEFRMLFPGQTIKSMHFRAQRSGSNLILHGNGWGHGVGMCQWGAKGLADRGLNYRRILSYYYRGIRIEKLEVQDKRFLAESD